MRFDRLGDDLYARSPESRQRVADELARLHAQIDTSFRCPRCLHPDTDHGVDGCTLCDCSASAVREAGDG